MDKQPCNRKMFAAFLVVMLRRFGRGGYSSARAYAFRYMCKFELCLDYRRTIFKKLKELKNENIKTYKSR